MLIFLSVLILFSHVLIADRIYGLAGQKVPLHGRSGRKEVGVNLMHMHCIISVKMRLVRDLLEGFSSGPCFESGQFRNIFKYQ